jgi:hypothetical protein
MVKFMFPSVAQPGNDEMSAAVELACSRLILPHQRSIHGSIEVPVFVVETGAVQSGTTMAESNNARASESPLVLPASWIQIVADPIMSAPVLINSSANKQLLLNLSPDQNMSQPEVLRTPPTLKADPISSVQVQQSKYKKAGLKERLGCSCKRCRHCPYTRQHFRTVCARCRDRRCLCQVCGQSRTKADKRPACGCTSKVKRPNQRVVKLEDDVWLSSGVESTDAEDMAAINLNPTMTAAQCGASGTVPELSPEGSFWTEITGRGLCMPMSDNPCEQPMFDWAVCP